MIELLWNAPVSESRMTEILAVLELNTGLRILDIGCGCGEVLIRLSERYQITGTGIDLSREHIDEARRRMRGRIPVSQIEFIEADGGAFPFKQNEYALALCLGATHAFASGSAAYRNAIERMIPLVQPGGLLLIADGYLKQPAGPEYRALLGEAIPDDMTHTANVATGQQLGLIPMAAWTSNEQEWDDFEWRYQRIVERKAREQPQDQGLQEKLRRRREWIQAYLQWGRATLGYGLYLFQKP
ncbi:SAM-dependent methyltransferase [Gimesia maris]|uniref:Demethylrebeccamycin-D-glucose O-methyltransferase n=1 Tax=Gimesia maris TaxID=122 RepID=A0ABX5YWP8_9PLAN|nr:class I SAM-dependent methyltransferase [Gimesia maris]EDL61030.1 methyltransferase [Gimesia maris DSM 8797]QDU18005.1 Demethylrebeccamycin-D-glucose O-methyltransferase [Gimesia maris]QEG20043.1 Demethylrebeccamycin-D-glucose O-methyltransferase [Gimesia maris]QGQ27165.1 class I SAM-dependent methyltransferase [Gimesia maris]